METINWTGRPSKLSLTGVLAKKTKNYGINWTWESLTDVSKSDKTKKDVYFAWQFEWDKLMKQGIDGLEGTITVTCNVDTVGFPKIFTVQVTRSGQWIEKCIGSLNDLGRLTNRGDITFQCSFSMTPFKNCDKLDFFNKTFAASDKTDAILVVEGKKLHVCKQFLSFHSEYFNTLFNSSFMEKSMNEIPIEDVKYEDFARLLCAVYPNPIFPTVFTYEILLKLADRFMMPYVTHLVELFLNGDENVGISEKIALADKYSMNELLETCLKSIETTTDLKKIRERIQFEELSDATKVKLFHKTLPFF